MEIRLNHVDRELRERARAFTEQVLIPLEDECEENDGLTPESAARAKQAVLDADFNAINHAPEDGGQGLDTFQQMLVEEQWGRATGALWDLPWRPSIPLARGTEAQKECYLRPAARGQRRDAYAITEEQAGSDPSMVRTAARRDVDGGWILDGEKWHVTSGDVADFFLVHAHVDGDPTEPTVFLVDKDRPGVRLVRTPRYTHTFVFEHPIFAFEGVHLPDDAVLGEVGQGYELTKDWFVEERLMIGARTMGASARALELSLAFASEREQFGQAIVGFQAIEFMLADMAAEIMAATSMLYRVCWMAARGGITRKELHAQASAVKLVCSETAGRVIDKAVQIHGGRGYMREQPVERLWRELRVDRIWEGTSEVQRMVIGNELRKRGPGVYTAVAVRALRSPAQVSVWWSSGRVNTWSQVSAGCSRPSHRERSRRPRIPGCSPPSNRRSPYDGEGAAYRREEHETIAENEPRPEPGSERPNQRSSGIVLVGPQDGGRGGATDADDHRDDAEWVPRAARALIDAHRCAYVPSRHPLTSSGSPENLSPPPPRTKSYGVPYHRPGRPGYAFGSVSSLRYWKPIQSGERNPIVS